jgi:hypothetical protein
MINKQFTQQFRHGIILILGIMGVFFLLTACNPPETVDKPASDLDVKAHVIDIEENPSDGKVAVVMQFFFDGKYVKLAGNAVMTCNGETLTDDGLGYAARVPQQPVGGTYTFQHSRGGVNTTAVVTVPARPVFSPPTVEGATITRTNNLTVFYIPDNGKSVRGRAGDGTNSTDNSQDDDGTHEGLDVSGFNAGSGTLGLTREYEDPINATGFHSAERNYTTSKRVNVTWQ